MKQLNTGKKATDKEIEYAQFLANDHRPSEIATIWGRSARTVEAYSNRIRVKTGRNTLTGALIEFYRAGLIK